MTAIPIPAHPLATAEMLALGLTRAELRRLVAEGVVRRVFTGVYVHRDVADTTEVRAACAARVLPAHSVVSDRSAAWIHGIDDYDLKELAAPPELEVVSIGGGRATRRGSIFGAERDLVPSDICLVKGVPVTTPLRTACDLAMLRGRNRAMAVLDAFRRDYGLREVDFGAILPRLAGRRGVIQLRELVPLSNWRSESGGESWTRMTAHDEGLPPLEAQIWVDLPGYGPVRVDLGDRHKRIALEYDGEEHHTDEQDRLHDELRRAALRSAGWIVIVVRKDGFSGKGREKWVRELRQAFADRAVVPRRRIYSRGESTTVSPRRRR